MSFIHIPSFPFSKLLSKHTISLFERNLVVIKKKKEYSRCKKETILLLSPICLINAKVHAMMFACQCTQIFAETFVHMVNNPVA